MALRWICSKRLLLGGALLFLLAFLIWRLWPLSHDEIRESEAQMVCHSHYELIVNGKPTLYFTTLSQDSTFTGNALHADSVMENETYTNASWVNRWALLPSCHGRIICTEGEKPSPLLNADNTTMRLLVSRQARQLDSILHNKQAEKEEIDYYLHRHNVTDDGFDMIARYATTVNNVIDSLQRILHTLHTIPANSILTLRYVANYTVLYQGKSVKVKRDRGNLFQTYDERTPKGVHTRMSVSQGAREVALRKPYVKPQPKNLRVDSAGIYRGEMNKNGIANGYGSYLAKDGTYYEGYWKDNQRDQFGFSVAPHQPLRIGEWKEDRYLGERMTYTEERVYGIDISKYQHGKGKKKYPIQWNKLRITHLGTISKKKVNGKVDYPVSFVYIKSTEGITIRNPYFLTDYTNAHKQGIPVGAYHFFSMRSSASQQAAYFLKNTRIRKGDQPPVLDVEPTTKQVRAMGEEVLLNKIRTWMNTVHRQTGVKPILYVSQNFVNKYLVHAPDLKQNYDVWIARYGEYKPDVKLAYWQLCPDGRVRGIHGEVDINVFNGYRSQFDDFLLSLHR